MSYDPRPNASGDTLVLSRDPIRINFQLIQSRFDENHVDIDGAAGGGKHKFLQMPEQSSGPTVAANEGGLYVKANTYAGSGNTVASLFYRLESTGSEILLSGETAPTLAAEGQTFLAGGLLMKWGIVTPITNSTDITVTYSTAAGFTAFSAAPFSVQVTKNRAASLPGQTSVAIAVASNAAASFHILKGTETSGGGHSWRYMWLSVGPA